MAGALMGLAFVKILTPEKIVRSRRVLLSFMAGNERDYVIVLCIWNAVNP